MLFRLPAMTVLVLMLTQLNATAAEPESYPRLTAEQFLQWSPLLVVADLKPGEYFQKTACPKDHICMDPPPFWLNANVVVTLQGAELPSTIRVSTTSHYGMERFAKEEGPYLLSLRSNGEKYIMPRYAVAPLVRDKHGALYLPILYRNAVSWLPCSVDALREEVFQENFDNGEAIAADEYKQDLASMAPHLYAVSDKRAWPRYAIPITRLRDYLLSAGPDLNMSCEPGTSDGKKRAGP